MTGRVAGLVTRALAIVAACALANCDRAPAAETRDSAASAGAVVPSPEPVDSAVPTIREFVERVERELPRHSCREVDVAGLSAEGGDVRSCTSTDSSATRITARLHGETGRMTEQLYLRGEELVFGYVVREEYTQPSSGVVAERREERLYFTNGELVRWLVSGNVPVGVGSAEARARRDELVRAVRTYRTCLRDTPDGDTCEVRG